jgi:hypothetical protein
LKLANINAGEWDACLETLHQQGDSLRSLELSFIEIKKFEWMAWKLEKLSIKTVLIQQKEGFQNFVAFIKSLDRVAELELDLIFDQRKNGNNYREVLTHLLNLPSLTKLNWVSPDIVNLPIHNPAVTTFTIDDACRDYSQFFRAFPGIQKLELHQKDYIIRGNLSTLKMLKHLTAFKFGKNFDSRNLHHIIYPQLEKLVIDCDIDFGNTGWNNFFERHPNIESLEMNVEFIFDSNEGYFKLLENLKKLRILKIHYTKFEDRDFDDIAHVQHIAENCVLLEHLELVVYESTVEKAVQYLRLKFPQHGCDSRKFKKYSETTEYLWLITVRKV